MIHSLLTIECPNCQKPVVWTETSAHRPFCSARCRLIDLGGWAGEEHRIPSDEVEPDEIADISHPKEQEP
jgi:uncharacterized protein